MYREVLRDVNLGQGVLKAKSHIFVDISAANAAVCLPPITNAKATMLIYPFQSDVFPDFRGINPSRGLDKYLAIDGAGRCLGLDLSSTVSLIPPRISLKSVDRRLVDDCTDGSCSIQF